MDVKKLITSIRLYPILYAISCNEYKNLRIIENVWKERQKRRESGKYAFWYSFNIWMSILAIDE